MGVVDTLITEYKMNNRDYVAGSNQVVSSTGQMGGAITRATGLLTTFASAVGVAGALLAGLSVASSRKAAEFDAMVKALEAVVGSAEDAKRALQELREIAAMPGLGLEEALKGYTALRRSGMDDQMAMRTISAAGNANAAASGGRAELEQILRAITQIATKPYLSGEELMQLNEAGIPASKIIQEKFGTSDGGELKKLGIDSQMALEALVQALEKTPRVASNAKNAIENFQMAIDMAMVAYGQALNTSFVPVLDTVTKALEKVTDKGLFESVGDALANIAMVTFPELNSSAEDLEGVIIEISATVVDAVAAFANLRLVIEQVIKVIEAMPGYRLHQWATDRVQEGIFGKDHKSQGDLMKESFEEKQFARNYSKQFRGRQREEEARIAAEAAANAKAEADAVAAAEKEAKDLAERTASYMKDQLEWSRRAALAGEAMVEISKSTVGGSAYGDRALSAAAMGGNLQAIIRREMEVYIGGIAMKQVGLANRRR